MKVSSTAPTVRYVPDSGTAAIEMADPRVGGNSSSGEKYGYEEKAVRLSWWGADGKFDPISSAELPNWALLDVIEACAASDFFVSKDAVDMIKALAASVQRQMST